MYKFFHAFALKKVFYERKKPVQLITDVKKLYFSKKFCMQLVSKVSFFYSANFPSHKKSITLLTCYINNYYLYLLLVFLINHFL
jgi:hypothetical protein